jgi:MSHA biogenesis protein MshK
MSLINDALKRATKARSHSANPGAAGEPMRPVDSHQSVALPRYFFPILLCVFCGALWFVIRGWDARRQATAEPTIVSVQAREATAIQDPASNPADASAANALVPESGLIADPLSVPAPASRNFSLNHDGASAETATSPEGPAPVEPVAPVVQTLRLQGIFYRSSGASALVNAQTVYVGDHIAGARVKAITRSSITLERDGQMQVLTLH